MSKDPDDWYPYYGGADVVAGLEKASVTPALCWITSATLEGSRFLKRCPVVAIWGRDHKAFRRAVRPAERVPVIADSYTRDKLTLAQLKAAIKRGETDD